MLRIETWNKGKWWKLVTLLPLKIYTDKIKPMKVDGDLEATTEERRKKKVEDGLRVIFLCNFDSDTSTNIYNVILDFSLCIIIV